MNTYITVGTYDFLVLLKQKYPQENMIMMVNENGALLLHETSGESVFKEPRKYEVIDKSGSLGEPGFFAMINIPITEEGRPIFEYQFVNRPKQIEHEPGFLAIRALRPLKSNTYIVLTAWENEDDFNHWKNSSSFKEAYNTKNDAKSIYAGPSYISKYASPETHT